MKISTGQIGDIPHAANWKTFVANRLIEKNKVKF